MGENHLLVCPLVDGTVAALILARRLVSNYLLGCSMKSDTGMATKTTSGSQKGPICTEWGDWA